METITVTVLRTCDATQTDIELPLSAPLNSLKDRISKSSLGPIDKEFQRLFHLGRELKSGRRSLATLGIGKFANFVVHLHSTAPPTIDLATAAAKGDDEVAIKRGGNLRANSSDFSNAQPVINLLDDGEDEEEIHVPPMIKRCRRR